MKTQLYNPDYLRGTQRLLEGMKRDSYQPLLNRGGKVADIGCGVGTDVINMAKLSSNGSVFVGMDRAREMIDQANLAKGGQANVEFVVGNADSLPFADGELSGLRAERLIQHLFDPVKVFNEFHRVLKVDATAVIVETDWNSVSFYNRDQHTARLLREYLVAHQVANGGAAANLVRYLQATGFRDTKIRLYPLETHVLEQCLGMLRIDYALEMMERNNHITPAAHRAFIDDLQHAEHSGCFVCSINLVIVTALK